MPHEEIGHRRPGAWVPRFVLGVANGQVGQQYQGRSPTWAGANAPKSRTTTRTPRPPWSFAPKLCRRFPVSGADSSNVAKMV